MATNTHWLFTAWQEMVSNGVTSNKEARDTLRAMFPAYADKLDGIIDNLGDISQVHSQDMSALIRQRLGARRNRMAVEAFSEEAPPAGDAEETPTAAPMVDMNAIIRGRRAASRSG